MYPGPSRTVVLQRSGYIVRDLHPPLCALKIRREVQCQERNRRTVIHLMVLGSRKVLSRMLQVPRKIFLVARYFSWNLLECKSLTLSSRPNSVCLSVNWNDETVPVRPHFPSYTRLCPPVFLQSLDYWGHELSGTKSFLRDFYLLFLFFS